MLYFGEKSIYSVISVCCMCIKTKIRLDLNLILNQWSYNYILGDEVH